MTSHDLERIEKTFNTRHKDIILTSPPLVGLNTIIATLNEVFDYSENVSWQERLNWGGLFINGVDIKCDGYLEFPCRIEYYEPKIPWNVFVNSVPKYDQSRIVYEDEFLLVYSKPPKLPCVSSREQRSHNLRSYIESILGIPVHMPSRLDLSTEGLVPVSKSILSHHALQKEYQHRRVTKRYLFRSESKPNWIKSEVTLPIGKSKSHPVLREIDYRGELDSTKSALTSFTVLNSDNNSTLIEAIPHTGRTHQIRVHAQYLNCSIIGDNFYSGKESDSLNLLCYELNIHHPINQNFMKIQIPDKLLPTWI
jgi:23S rRNA-/tRNA-specific pseudouridylate synthase